MNTKAISWGTAMSIIARSLFMKIAEPRIIRLMQFGVYLCMIIAGFAILEHPQRSFENVLGAWWVDVMGWFIFGGAIVGSIAVLPGIWWLERVGLIALGTGMSIYAVVIITIGSSPMGMVVAIAFVLTFAQRWTEIRRFQLAPREG